MSPSFRRLGVTLALATTAALAPVAAHADQGRLSGDGKVFVFRSNAANLPGANGSQQAYLRNISTGKTMLLSVNNSGATASVSGPPRVSADGRIAIFSSTAKNLPGANGHEQIYIRNISAGTTTLVSRNSSGAPGNGASYAPAIDADGSRVFWRSSADNLPGGVGDHHHVYRRDLPTGQTIVVSFNTSGQPDQNTDEGAYQSSPAVSADGNIVAFDSYAPNLPGAVEDESNVYVRNISARTTVLASRNSAGQVTGWWPTISADGTKVAFTSYTADHSAVQVRLRNLSNSSTTVVSMNNSGQAANGGGAWQSAISPDGTKVGFISKSMNFAGANGFLQVYVRNLVTGFTTMISKNNAGSVGNNESFRPNLSRDGLKVLFGSLATNMPNANSHEQSYLRDTSANTTTLVSRNNMGQPAGAAAALWRTAKR